MSELTKNYDAALRQFWLTILVIFFISTITWNFFYWDWAKGGFPVPEDIDSNLVFGFIIRQVIALFMALTLALLYHLPLLLTRIPRPKRTNSFLIIYVQVLIILQIFSLSPYISVNCATGDPFLNEQKFGLASACIGQNLPFWLAIILFSLIATLSFLCLLNIIQAAKGAMEYLKNKRKPLP
jgi:hypothetical protein